MTDHQLVKVTWFDAHDICTGWTHVSELDADRYVCVTVGHLLPSVVAGHITVAQSIAPGDHVDNVTAIPLVNVIAIHALNPAIILPVEEPPL